MLGVNEVPHVQAPPTEAAGDEVVDRDLHVVLLAIERIAATWGAEDGI